MKTKTWIVLLSGLFALCLGLSLYLLRPVPPAASARVLSQGQCIAVLDLQQDQQITVPAPNGGSNTVTVKGGKIAVTTATCPDQYCVQRGFCASGAQIVCLPNQLVIQFQGKTELDGVSG